MPWFASLAGVLRGVHGGNASFGAVEQLRHPQNLIVGVVFRCFEVIVFLSFLVSLVGLQVRLRGNTLR